MKGRFYTPWVRALCELPYSFFQNHAAAETREAPGVYKRPFIRNVYHRSCYRRLFYQPSWFSGNCGMDVRADCWRGTRTLADARGITYPTLSMAIYAEHVAAHLARPC